jgi:ABC-type branched-subunit amino acid transport system substrate-binding protein
MQGQRRSPRYGRIALSVGVVAAVLLAACGSSGSSKGASPTNKPKTTGAVSTTPQTTDLGQGVTADSIKLGVVLIDYSAIASYVDFTRGDQKQAYQVFIDDVNKHGGIQGRKIVPSYQQYVSIGSTGPTKACTALTEDSKVFATVGVLYDPTGASQLCFAKQHKAILMTHELTQSMIQAATPAMLLTDDITAERKTKTEIALLGKQGLLKDKKVAILAETATKGEINDAIKPAFQALKVPLGTSGVLAVGSDPDTTAAQAQLDSFIERWKGEGVNAVFISGLSTVSKAFVQKIKAGMPGVMLMTNSDSSAQGAARDAVSAHITPNPYEGIYSLVGNDDETTFESPGVQRCVKIYEAATGHKVVAPKDLKAGKDGKRAEIYITVQDACGDITFFKVVADKVGKYLNLNNWTNTVNTFGDMGGQLVSTEFASLGEGKYDASNGFSLVSFDSSLGVQGDWKKITPLADVTKE